jgi:VWFA-related protein
MTLVESSGPTRPSPRFEEHMFEHFRLVIARLIRKTFGASLCAAILFAVISVHKLRAQGQQSSSDQTKIRVTSALVFLDVTVLDKKGHPVMSGLTKDDFTITEYKEPQPIFSFEAPETHVIAPSAGDSNPDGKAPVTILVLDLLNSSFQDFAYIRYEVAQFLKAQPPQLADPTELIVIGNKSLEMLQSYTRSRANLLNALNHLPATLPYKKMNGAFFWERFVQSLDGLQQIALQNKGVPGRKNIVWVGHGGPNIYLDTVVFPAKLEDELKQYVHSTTNMMVDARISLFVIYPGLPVWNRPFSFSALQAGVDIGDDDPFAGDVNFGVFVNETGGEFFYNRNDLDMEIKQSEQMGAGYYTLTYQPQNVDPNGKFRRIRVSLRDPKLHAVTKAGYFAPDKNAPINPRQQRMIKLSEAVHSTIPFNALDVSLSDAVRHPDSQTVEFTVQLKSKSLIFLPAGDGKDAADLTVAAASLNEDRGILAAKTEVLTLLSTKEDPNRLPQVATRFQLTVRVPRNTKSVRVAIEDQDGGRIGAAELDRKTIDDAPARDTPRPQLHPRSPEHVTCQGAALKTKSIARVSLPAMVISCLCVP